MDQKFLLIIVIVAILLLAAYLLGRLHSRGKVGETPQDFVTVYNEIRELPSRVLATLQGSINPQKGKVAELLTYAELRYDYDVIIPLGKPIDFIGVKNGEKIDFIEVKSGVQKALTEEEKEIERLIKSGKVNFRLVLVSDREVRGLVNEE